MSLELIVFIGMCLTVGALAIKIRRLAMERRGTGRLAESGSTVFYMLDRGGVYGPKYPEEGKNVRKRKRGLEEREDNKIAEGVR